jgi:predicted nucleic acid-binding protein
VAAVVLDASVLIGLLDRDDAHHAAAVDDVDAADLAALSVMTPASAYSEALVAFARTDRLSDGRDAIANMGITVVPLTGSIAERAAEIRAAHDRLRLPDALVLATAQQHDARLLTYDDQLARFAREY